MVDIPKVYNHDDFVFFLILCAYKLSTRKVFYFFRNSETEGITFFKSIPVLDFDSSQTLRVERKFVLSTATLSLYG